MRCVLLAAEDSCCFVVLGLGAAVDIQFQFLVHTCSLLCHKINGHSYWTRGPVQVPKGKSLVKGFICMGLSISSGDVPCRPDKFHGLAN